LAEASAAPVTPELTALQQESLAAGQQILAAGFREASGREPETEQGSVLVRRDRVALATRPEPRSGTAPESTLFFAPPIAPARHRSNPAPEGRAVEPHLVRERSGPGREERPDPESGLASTPSLNPSGTGRIVSGFGWRTSPWPEFHSGVDLEADYGQPIRAGASGVVVSAGWDGGYGIKVDVDHQNGYHTWYAHLSHADVEPGQHVVRGQTLGEAGSTGASTGPHLHYQVMHRGNAVDPAPFLGGAAPRAVAGASKDGAE
jgi:murein DD-endopeptidase MepM/ murein hydrolase activator NlpD